MVQEGLQPSGGDSHAVSALVAVVPVLAVGVPGMHTAAQYSWFIGCGLGGLAIYYVLATRTKLAVAPPLP